MHFKVLLHVELLSYILWVVSFYYSSSAWLKSSAHPTVSKVDRRISLLTGLNVQHPYGEHLQVVNYGIGGHYEPHFDHATVRKVFIFDNRISSSYVANYITL